MQLPDHADTRAALAVDRNDRFDTDLKRISDPDHAWIDGAGRDRAGVDRVCNRRLQRGLDDWNQVIDEVGQAEILHGGIEIRHAVLQRATPYQDVRIDVDLG